MTGKVVAQEDDVQLIVTRPYITTTSSHTIQKTYSFFKNLSAMPIDMFL